MRADCKLSGLSGNEIYCMRLKGLIPSGVVRGTAIRRLSGMGVKTQTLPAQAIIRDKDTWLSGPGGFDVTSIRAGG